MKSLKENGRERARSPFRGLTSEPLRSPRLSSDVDRVLGVLKGIWAREGSNLRTFVAAPCKGHGCEPGINDRKSKNGRERARTSEPHGCEPCALTS